MFLRYTKLSDGPGPSEMLVGVQTVEGRREEVVISLRQAQIGLEVGAPLAEDNGTYLVELPREAMSGNWRIWVTRDQLEQTAVAAE